MVGKRPGIGKMVWALIIVAVLVVAGAEIYLSSHSSSGGTKEIDITIVETDPVKQLDHFFPDNVTVPRGQSVQLAVLNGDDELRVFTISALNVNMTLNPGETQRVNFVANQAGTFTFISPKTPPSPVSNGLDGPFLNGTFTVT